MDNERCKTMTGPAQAVRAALQAYVDKDRAAIEKVIADDYRFTSPLDNGLTRETYFAHCWPNSEATEHFEILHLVEDGDRAFVVYELEANGKRFRNCELHTARAGQLVDTQVYFGWDLPHRAAPGQFVEDDA